MIQAVLAIITLSLALWYSPDGSQWLLRTYFGMVAGSCVIGVWIGWPKKP
jgi:hypothetical protein